MPTAMRLAIEIPFDPDSGSRPFLLTGMACSPPGHPRRRLAVAAVAERVHFDVVNAYTLALIGSRPHHRRAAAVRGEHWISTAEPAQIIQLPRAASPSGARSSAASPGPLRTHCGRAGRRDGLDVAAPGSPGHGDRAHRRPDQRRTPTRATDLRGASTIPTRTRPPSPTRSRGAHIGRRRTRCWAIPYPRMFALVISGPSSAPDGVLRVPNTYAVMRVLVSYLRVDSAGTC